MHPKRLVKHIAWQLVFANNRIAYKACKLLQTANRANQFCKPGIGPMAHNNTVVIQWHRPALHYSVHMYLYKLPTLRAIFGQQTCAFDWKLEPAKPEEAAALEE